jgi:hypothetical protein
MREMPGAKGIMGWGLRLMEVGIACVTRGEFLDEGCGVYGLRLGFGGRTRVRVRRRMRMSPGKKRD